jgi:hypothetical protein
MKNFDWERLNLMFPEWSIDRNTGEREKIFSTNFPENPDFSQKGQIKFAYKNYGLEIFIPTVPLWIKETKSLKTRYQKLSNSVYESVLKDFQDSFKILENWRLLVNRYENHEWKGNLSDHLEFRNNCSSIEMGDYFNCHIANSANNIIGPTTIITKIKNLPQNSLNAKWALYSELSENIVSSGLSTDCKRIQGKTFFDCIKNAEEIYSYASELSELDLPF